MFIIKRIVTFISALLGGSLGLILLGFVNWVFSLGLSFSNVFIFGVLGGIAVGILTAYLLTAYLMRKAKKFVTRKFGNAAARFTNLRKVAVPAD